MLLYFASGDTNVGLGQRRRYERCPGVQGRSKHPATAAPVACLSPYTCEHISRFGQYVLDMNDLPEPLETQSLPFEPTL